MKAPANPPAQRLEAQYLTADNLRLRLEILKQQVRMEPGSRMTGLAKLDVNGDGHMIIKTTGHHTLGQQIASRLKDISGRRSAVNSRVKSLFKPALRGKDFKSSEHASDKATRMYVDLLKKEMSKENFSIEKCLVLTEVWKQKLSREIASISSPLMYQDPDNPIFFAALIENPAKPKGTSALIEDRA